MMDDEVCFPSPPLTFSKTMLFGEGRLTWNFRQPLQGGNGRRGSWARPACFLVLCWMLPGCVTSRELVEKKLTSAQQAAQRYEGVLENYQVGCPDILRLVLTERPALDGDYTVGPEGCIFLPEYGSLRVDGVAPPEIAQKIAAETGTEPDQVKVAVAGYHSQHVILFGQVIGWQRVVPYQGQETVLDLLHRTGGITRGAAPGDVHVVRTHMENGKRPEVYRIDLAAIVMKNDERTNLRLLPFDQVYVGETRQCRIEKIIPPWLRPIYQALWDTRPDQPEAREPMSHDPRPRWLHFLPQPKSASPEARPGSPPPESNE
jgi:protein involved in polysaccharide export with SLBB domain